MSIHLRIEALPYPPSRDDEVLLCPGAKGWRPQRVLERLGPAQDSSETLIRLMLACAIIEGPNRMEELVLQIQRLCSGYISHLEAKLNDRLFASLHRSLKPLIRELSPPRAALDATRARLANTTASSETSLVHYDLHTIVHYGRLAVFAYLIGTSRGRVGAENLIEIFSLPPTSLDAEHWRERLFPGTPFISARIFEPKEYGRLVVVMRDGVLMYDPIPE